MHCTQCLHAVNRSTTFTIAEPITE